MSMTLLIATPLYPPETGGPATYVRILEEQLPGRGIEVRVVKFSSVRRYPKVLRHVLCFWQVLKNARGVDAILALDPVSVGVPAVLAAMVLRKPFFLKMVGDYAWEQGRQRFGVSSPLDRFVHERSHNSTVELLKRIQFWVAQKAKRVIVPSAYLKTIVTAWGVPSERIEVIHNGVAVGEPGAVPPAFSEVARPRIVTAARLVPWKGIGGLIDAIAEIRTDVPSVSLVVIGEGPHREHLESYAAARLKEGFVFLGALDHAETLAAIKEADVFALNTSYEGLSHVLIEAMALGASIVTTTAGGNPELIEDRKEGLLVPTGDRDGLEAALREMLADPALRTALAANAKQKAGAFSEVRMVEQTAAFFDKQV